MASSTNTNYSTQSYKPRHATWPYTSSDFTRQDLSPDPSFYSSPRFVTHIDDAAIASLRDYYATVLPPRGRILDFCSSWVSHYPEATGAAAVKGDLRITGMGMNKAELAANPVLNNGRLLIDLNVDSDISSALLSANAIGPSEDEKLDTSTAVVSIDYLTSPVEVLRSLLSATKAGGTVHLTISNRCFPTKAIRRWLRVDEEERLLMVGDFLHFAGWSEVEIVTLSDGKVAEQDRGEAEASGGLQGLMGWLGMRGRDPVWVVRATKR